MSLLLDSPQDLISKAVCKIYRESLSLADIFQIGHFQIEVSIIYEPREFLCILLDIFHFVYLATGMLLKDHPAFKPKSNQTDQPATSESNRKFDSVLGEKSLVILTIFFSDVHNYLNDLKKKGETQSGDDVGHYISKLKNKVKMNKNFQLYKSKPGQKLI